MMWRKSSFSGGGGAGGGNCVEIAATSRKVHVRDSKNPSGRLTFTPTEFAALLHSVRSTGA
jgi:hypothetical protein